MKIIMYAIWMVMLLMGPLFPQTDDPRPECLNQGKNLYEQKQYKESLKILSACADDSAAWSIMGLSYFELYDMKNAKYYLAKAIQCHPYKLDWQIRYADALSWNKEFKSAIQEYTRLAKQYPQNIEIKKGWARALAWNKNYSEALAQYQELLKNDPRDYTSWIQIGVITSWQKKFNEAIVVFNKILASQPPLEWEIAARLKMAEVIGWNRDFAGAIAEYGKVLMIKKDAVDAYLGMGQIYEWQGEYKKAIAQYDQTLQIDPANKTARQKLEQLIWVK